MFLSPFRCLVQLVVIKYLLQQFVNPQIKAKLKKAFAMCPFGN